MSRISAAVLLAISATMFACPVLAQSPEPVLAQSPGPVLAQSPEPAPPWPTGDELRRELQEIGFVFRIDGATGDWSAWAPPFQAADAPAMELAGAGTRPAAATFEMVLIDADPSLALTAWMEVASRLPLALADVDRARRFIVEDLLEDPPETLEPCYTTDWARGAVLISVDTETTTARLSIAEDVSALDPSSTAAIARRSSRPTWRQSWAIPAASD